MTAEELIHALVVRGTDDWVAASDVVSIAKFIGRATSEEEITECGLVMVGAVTERGLMEVGDVTDGGFFACEMPRDQAVKTVGRRWRALGRLPQTGEICWLANTEEGDQLGNALLDAGYTEPDS